MADVTKDELRKEIAAILKGANLSSTSSKKVRQDLEDKLECSLASRKKEIDELVMEYVSSKSKGKGKAAAKSSEDDEDEEEEEEEDDEEEEGGEEDGAEENGEGEDEEEESEEEVKKPAKRASTGKKPAPKKKKAAADSDASEPSDDGESEEEYSPKKAGKPARGRKLPPKKKKGSESDSDEDWGKKKKGAAGVGKKGGGGGGKGYTRQLTLSPELAALVGQDKMARHEVVKAVWDIIKKRNLYDPKNKQYAICDDALLKVIGTKRFRTFGMMKYLKDHFVG